MSDKDTIYRQDAIDAIMSEPPDAHYPSWYADVLKGLPSACNETKQQATKVSDCISRQAAIDEINEWQRKLIYCFGFENDAVKIMDIEKSIITAMPSAQLECEYTMEEFMYGQDLGSPEDWSL